MIPYGGLIRTLELLNEPGPTRISTPTNGQQQCVHLFGRMELVA